MKQDPHVNCVETISLGCAACGLQTILETAEFDTKRCPRCGHIPGHSLAGSSGITRATVLRNRIKPMSSKRTQKARERFTVKQRVA